MQKFVRRKGKLKDLVETNSERNVTRKFQSDNDDVVWTSGFFGTSPTQGIYFFGATKNY